MSRVLWSGATEANALAIAMAKQISRETERTEILTGAADHASLKNEADRAGLKHRSIELNGSGAPDPTSLETVISDATALVSLVGVNNENGAIADLEALGSICADRGVFFHVDLSQAPLAIDIDLLDLHIDCATISAHKIYGPKGIGALLLTPPSFERVKPIVVGAGQQGGHRGGTLPTELIVGFGEACRLLAKESATERATIAKIRDGFVGQLVERFGVELVGSLRNRHPGNALMRFYGQDASDLLSRLQPIVAASSQSACASGSIEPSHVLTAMGFDREEASECIRFSFGRFSTMDQAASAVEAIGRTLHSAA